MFSKALFKQSCKANYVMWAIVTVAVCFMLACVMLISGSGSISKIKNGISDTIIMDSIDCEIDKRAINYYLIAEDGLKTFDNAYKESYMLAVSNGEPNPNAVAMVSSLTALNEYVSTLIASKNLELNSAQAKEIQGVVFYTLNINIVNGEMSNFDEFYTAENPVSEVAPVYDIASLITASETERNSYISDYCRDNVSIFLTKNMVSEENIAVLVESLKDYGIDRDGYEKLSYEIKSGEETQKVSKYTGISGYNYIKKMSLDTINTLVSRVNYYVENGGDRDEIISSTAKDLTTSFLETLPLDVSNALQELGQMDLYSMVVGSIFLKMAGLLLPIIYVIMAANNLIAVQVDRGSMAYILSTSTKRKQVVFTQAVFLIGSLFLMSVLMTITSMVCFSLVNVDTTLTITKLLFLNIGAFGALFAMSGISFLASCWFNRSKFSMSIGGGLNMFFLVATMLGLFGSNVLPSVIRLEALNYFNYVSIISLFDVVNIIDGGWTFLIKLAVLFIFGFVCYFIGSRKFIKKDLPL